jgi:V/A-type H+-transporting ATPase subunit D
MPAVIPTKGNLIATKRSVTLATLGYDLMARPRNIRIREMLARIDDADTLQGQIDSTFSEAYASLPRHNHPRQSVCETGGARRPVDNTVTVHASSVMGVELRKFRSS